MTAFDEERLARLISLLPPAPTARVRAAQELPLARAGLDETVARREAARLLCRAPTLDGGAERGYEAALLARAQSGGQTDERRDFGGGQAFARAAEPPLESARTATDVAELAVTLARNGDPALQADA